MLELFLFGPSRAPWGDYGHVLAHGISWHSPRREDGALALECVGPFTPPITFPGGSDVVMNTTSRIKVPVESVADEWVSFSPTESGQRDEA